MLIQDLPTPCLLIDEARMENNLARMQARAKGNRVALRPHLKTHKSIDLGRRQLDMGAVGVTVAKPAEAEIFVNEGFTDVRIAYPSVSQDHFDRISELMDRATVSFCVDTWEGASAASTYFNARGHNASILVEIDTGYGRCGVPWNAPESISFVQRLATLPGLNIIGILTHAGNAYAGGDGVSGESTRDYVQRVANEERDRMLAFAISLYDAGIRLPDRKKFEISIGSTPTMSAFRNASAGGFEITEIRVGNYIFNDAIQVKLGSANMQDCALTVMSTVVSRHRDKQSQERLFLDAGRKVFTSDTGFDTDGFGVILHSARTMTPLPHARLTGLSEEHGWLRVTGGSTLAVGDRVRVVPNHACVVMNLQDTAHIVSGENVVKTIQIDARGQVT